jgi:hypothetical protein
MSDEQHTLLEQLGPIVQTEADLENLHPALRPYAMEHERLGWSLRHPLVYMVMGVMCGQANAMYDFKVKELKEAQAEKNFRRYIWLHERPYRIDRLIDLWNDGEISQPQLRELLTDVWTDSENPMSNNDPQNLLDLFHDACYPGGTLYDHVVGGAWFNPWAQPVWRGTSREEAESGQFGMSWTCKRERAEWFARRWNDEPVVLEGYMPDRKRILGFFAGRDEDEIVVDPNDVVLKGVIRL